MRLIMQFKIPRQYRNLLYLLLVCYAGLYADNPDPATRITYITEEFPPSNYTVNGTPTGSSVEILKAMWKQMGVPPQPIKVMPWARGYAEALSKPGTMLFSIVRTPERDSLFQWVGPFYSTRLVLVSLQGKGPKIHSLDQARKHRTAALYSEYSENAMRKLQFDSTNLIACKSYAQAFQLLKTGRIAFIAINESALESFAAESGLSMSQLYIALEVQKSAGYYALHKDTDPKLVIRFQNALNAIAEQRKAINKRYHPND